MEQNTLHLSLNFDQNLIPFEVPAQRVLEIRAQAPVAVSQKSRPSLNLALVLDQSGSMSGDKLEYVKQAAIHVLDLLEERDRVAIVAYDDEINLLSSSIPVSKENYIDLKNRVNSLKTGGSTNLSGGWLAGCQEAAAAAQEGTLNRTLLLTDGLANVGITDFEELAQHAKELVRRGVSTSTFGVGEGFNEHLLEAMSDQGGGNFYYIKTAGEIPALFLSEFKELSTITAREVEINLEIPPHVDSKVLGGWRVETTQGQLHIFLGDLFSGRTQEVYVKLLTPPTYGSDKLVIGGWVSGKGEGGLTLIDKAVESLCYIEKEKVELGLRNKDVLQRFALVDLAENANEALKLERLGDGINANRLLRRAIEANRLYLDPNKVEEYQRMAERMKNGMDEADRKMSHYNTYNQRRHKEP